MAKRNLTLVEARKRKLLSSLTTGMVFLIGLALILWAYGQSYQDESTIVHLKSGHGPTNCAKCHNKRNRKMAMIQYFRGAGNPHPELSATAVLSTNKPRLLAAIAVKGEKNTPYTVRRGGYKKRHAGMYQVNPKDWGAVPHNPIDQAKQADRILDELMDKKPIRQALNNYGGDSTDAYSNRVLAELVRVP